MRRDHLLTARRQIKAFNRPLNEFYCFKLPGSRMSWFFCKHGFQKSRYIIITITIIIIIIIIIIFIIITIIIMTTIKPFSQISPFLE